MYTSMAAQPVTEPLSLSHSESVGLEVGNPTALLQALTLTHNPVRIPGCVQRCWKGVELLSRSLRQLDEKPYLPGPCCGAVGEQGQRRAQGELQRE